MRENKSDNIEKFGNALTQRIYDTFNAMQPYQPELGIINADLSLSPDNSPGPIPKGEYMVCRQLTLGETDDPLTVTAVDGGHVVFNPKPEWEPIGKSVIGYSDEHSHIPLIPEKMRWLHAGDRVLICWAGDTPVIVDIVYVDW